MTLHTELTPPPLLPDSRLVFCAPTDAERIHRSGRRAGVYFAWFHHALEGPVICIGATTRNVATRALREKGFHLVGFHLLPTSKWAPIHALEEAYQAKWERHRIPHTDLFTIADEILYLHATMAAILPDTSEGLRRHLDDVTNLSA